ncbi:hypothetical protein PROFUN_00690 [Planoprotostelium fungivorum]|uniref:Uncharacterized protein n=1 Tax=Planoprotostelium fungivorum TaxID=1890364 RepID=A0A2P6NU39_9EUKA|nr:hypothetical protein PROFUN_00690 [Planoprotostelium fungivorum]
MPLIVKNCFEILYDDIPPYIWVTVNYPWDHNELVASGCAVVCRGRQASDLSSVFN